MFTTVTITRRRLMLAAAAAALPIALGAGWRAVAPATAEGAYFAEDGVALRGYDPVAYFTEGRPVEGSAAFSADWGGVAWRFASAKNRAAFLADPATYVPQYGGFCAWAVATKGEAYPIDPAAWRIVGGRLYLNFDRSIQAEWERDIPGFVGDADRRWPGLRARLTERAEP